MAVAALSVVHGLSTLLVDGPIEMDQRSRDKLARVVLYALGAGITSPAPRGQNMGACTHKVVPSIGVAIVLACGEEYGGGRSSEARPCHHIFEMVSEHAAHLVEQLQDASNALIGLAERIPADRWLDVATPGEWSPGKDAEHVAEGNALHQWEVRSTLRQQAGKRPVIERARLTARLAQPEVIRLLKRRAEESSSLLELLTDQQLDLPCRTRTLGEFIERVLIGHYWTHHAAIERKLRRAK